jgi:hypothetical protein
MVVIQRRMVAASMERGSMSRFCLTKEVAIVGSCGASTGRAWRLKHVSWHFDFLASGRKIVFDVG